MYKIVYIDCRRGLSCSDTLKNKHEQIFTLNNFPKINYFHCNSKYYCFQTSTKNLHCNCTIILLQNIAKPVSVLRAATEAPGTSNAHNFVHPVEDKARAVLVKYLYAYFSMYVVLDKIHLNNNVEARLYGTE